MNIKPTARQLRYYEKAKLTSNESNHEKPMGCVIVCGNFIVSRGFNKTKSHTIQHRNDRKSNYYAPNACMHAEVDALIKSGRFDLTGCEIFLYRQDKHGNIANSRPCISCMPALESAGIKHVFYTTKEGFAYERIS